MYKKTCKVVVLRNKPIAFLKSSMPSPSSLLKLPIVSSSTGCAGELNRKARIVKVRFSTAMHRTSWQIIVDGTRWKRVPSYAS